jgi:hypothetical protein
MGQIRKYLKSTAIFFTILIFCSGCNVYYSEIASIDQAVQSSKKAKVTTVVGTNTYKKLERMDGNLYGVRKKNSNMSKSFSSPEYIENADEKYVNILLQEEQIREIHLKNQTVSTVLTVTAISAAVLGLTSAIFMVAAADAMTSWD